MKSASMRRLAFAAAASLIFVSCGGTNSTSQQSAHADTNTPPQVDVIAVQSKKLETTTTLPAELMPYEAVDLFAKETGFIKSIRVDRGTKVKGGELIAVLEAPELVARRAEASARYQSAESQLAAGQAKTAADQATYKRMSNAARTPGVVAANDLEVAEKAAQSDEANVVALKKTADAAQEGVRAVEQLESYLKITAPFAGQITTRYVHPGALVGPASGAGAATPVVRIETVNRHRMVVPVPENDVAGVPEGTMVNFTVPSFPGRVFGAPITRISRGVDLKTRTMPVELDVRDSKAELVPGMFCTVEWPVHRAYPTLFVPASAVASDLQRSFVVRIQQNHAE
ncbi:MAG: efflux RND transporter periplasmic adaptor subunit [Acidobacteria bacterium]|nr:efflux RND transporter periplasmic adaptor subunit [Acidobacteriota bacterium]